jgi:hypothetical protein
MAVDTVKIDRIRVLAAKVETTTGTPISLSGTDGQFIVLNPSMTADDPVNEREAQAGLGMYPSVPGAQGGRLTFEVELTGSGASGTVPPWATTFLPACGMTNTTGTFAFASSNVTLTFGLYEDGLLRILSGARGNYTISAKSGNPVRVQFEFMGKYQLHTDVSILSPTFPTVIPPVFANSTFTLGAYAPILSQFDLTPGNEVTMRESGAAGDTLGYRAAAIVGRKPSLTLDPEAVAVATKDWRALTAASTQLALSIVIGSTANNIITIASSTCQVTGSSRGNRNGLMIDQLRCVLTTTTPYTIAFS